MKVGALHVVGKLASLVHICQERQETVKMGVHNIAHLKIDPQTKVIELDEGYKSCLGRVFDRGLGWAAKREILSDTRRFWTSQ